MVHSSRTKEYTLGFGQLAQVVQLSSLSMRTDLNRDTSQRFESHLEKIREKGGVDVTSYVTHITHIGSA